MLVDAGPLVAILSKRDQHHEVCTKQMTKLKPPLQTCWPVIIEAVYLLRRDFGGVEKLIDFFDRGVLQLLTIEQMELREILAIVKRYCNLEAQLADAALIYLAGRENINTVFTLDRRDFSVYRTTGNRSFTIVP